MTGPGRPTAAASLTSEEIEEVIAAGVPEEDDAEVQRRLAPYMLAAGSAGAAWIAAYLSKKPLVTAQTPALRSHVATRLPETRSINRTTRARLRARLNRVRALDDIGDMVEAAEDAVSAVYRSAVVYRAPGIGITEVGVTWGFGTWQEIIEELVPARLWATQGDDRVRDSHVTMEGQCRAYDEAFVSGAGNRLMYPGDRTAPAHDVYGCRCVEVPLVGGCDSRNARLLGRNRFQALRAYWKAATVDRAPFERAIAKELRKVFLSQRIRTREALARALRM